MTIQSDKGTLIGDAINMVADELAEEKGISKCQAVSIIGAFLTNETVKAQLGIDKNIEDAIERHTLASCLMDNKYLFRD